MSEHPACPHCGQRMMYMRAGARLPPKKARIFDAIARSGQDGISGADVIESLRLEVGENGIRAHVWQINEILQQYGSDTRILQRSKMYRMIGERKTALAKEKRI